MKKLSQYDLQALQTALINDYGIKIEGKELYDTAFNLLKFFESLIEFDKRDTAKKKQEVRKSS